MLALVSAVNSGYATGFTTPLSLRQATKRAGEVSMATEVQFGDASR